MSLRVLLTNFHQEDPNQIRYPGVLFVCTGAEDKLPMPSSPKQMQFKGSNRRILEILETHIDAASCLQSESKNCFVC